MTGRNLNSLEFIKTMVIIIIIGSNIIYPIQSSVSLLNQNQISLNMEMNEINNGDYLIYDVLVNEFVTSNLSMVVIGANNLYDNPVLLSTKLHVEFYKTNISEPQIQIVLSFSMKGEGFLSYDENTSGKISFDYNFVIRLYGNESSNVYFYQNGTEWGFLPFIIPKPTSSSDIKVSGSTYYSSELVKCEKSGNSFSNSPQGNQDAYILDYQNNITAFGFQDNLRLIPTYYFDSDKHILLKSSINDPFWTIFDREFVLFDGSMILGETNMDLGSASLGSILITLLSLLGAFIIPIVFIISTVAVFSLYKYRRKQRSKKRRIAKKNRLKFKKGRMKQQGDQITKNR